MKTIDVKIKDLKRADYSNPRAWSEKDIEDLKKGIKEFGVVDPIILNGAPKRKNIIIGGHFRVKVCEELGMETIPAVYVNIPSVKKEQALNLRLNKNTGDWDWEILREFDEDLLLEVGFSSEEIEDAQDEEISEDHFDEGKTEKVRSRAKVGDLYQLGRHRLYCGDSTSDDSFKVLMDGKKANLIFTDPPYNVDYESESGNSYSKGKYGGGKIMNDKKSDEDALKFYKDVLTLLHKYSEDNSVIYWWFANKNNWINRKAFMETGWYMSQVLIWLKDNMIFSMGQDYHRCYEPCMFGWKEKQTRFTNKLIRTYRDVHNLDFEEFEDMMDVWYEKRDDRNNYIHPTQKPVRLAERGLRKNSKVHDIVLDVFGGSGSTLIACEQMNRSCYMMELDPKFVDRIIERWEKFTNKKAQKL